MFKGKQTTDESFDASRMLLEKSTVLQKREMIMSTFVPSALISVALLSSVFAASARVEPVAYDNFGPQGRVDSNTPESLKPFWQDQQRYRH